MNKRKLQTSAGLIPLTNENHRLAIFKGKEIRKTIHGNEWWFVINDVVAALTDSVDPAQYFKRLKQRDLELAKLIGQGGVQIVPQQEFNSGSRCLIFLMYCFVSALSVSAATTSTTENHHSSL